MSKEITYTEYSQEGCDDNDWRDGVRITDEEGKGLFSISAGEPEDMTLGRDLSDAWRVRSLILKANKLGLEGTTIIFKLEEEED